MSASERAGELLNQLAAHTYEARSSDFVRPSDDPIDEVVATIVRGVVDLGAEGSDTFRQRLDHDGVDTLQLFAMRRTLQGRRSASLSLLDEVGAAYALLERLDDVPWESWLKTALYIVRSLGGDLEMFARRYRELATRASAARFDVAAESMVRVDSLLQCQVIEVTTSHGTGFIELLVFRDTTIPAFWGAPRLGDNQVTYRPVANLAQLAVTVADALDASTQFQTGPLGQDQLAASMFALTVSGSYLPSAGCISFVAESTEGTHAFTVFVAELVEDTDVTSLAVAANGLDGQAAVANARLLIVMTLQPRFDENGDGDGDFDFSDVEDITHSALLDTTYTTWTPS